MVMSDFLKIVPHIANGLVVTVWVTTGAAFVAAIMAFASGTAARFANPAIRRISRIYVEVFRGVPALVQLFWLYYALPLLGVKLSAPLVGITGLGLCFGAYGSEVVRNALDSVPRGQTEAARSLGLTEFQLIRYVVFAQAIRMVIPQLGNLVVDLLKSSALVSLITLHDLTFSAQKMMQETQQTAVIFGIVVGVYYLLSLGIGAGIRTFERQLSWPAR